MIEIKTGLDVIRGALLNRAKHGHLGTLARDLGVNVGDLEDFAYGRGSLPPATLQALATDLFGGHAEYDSELNRTEAKPLGVPPPPFRPDR